MMAQNNYIDELEQNHNLWLEDINTIKEEISDLITELAEKIDDNEELPICKKLSDAQNNLVGLHMLFENLVTDIINFRYALRRYSKHHAMALQSNYFQKHKKLATAIQRNKNQFDAYKAEARSLL
ncbi:hypothetical protein R9C00_20005 [Flammeovirgaceae bacterium SG7u.111]|nr:hypothetical protein [Flammeovirgaceae bacterium SG7u.132]WPO33985.1 hypothetical protein R9C00_20005 [Flammeovirgaceae bacterium SG7u.111]